MTRSRENAPGKWGRPLLIEKATATFTILRLWAEPLINSEGVEIVS
jgi:hypothetical protein